MHSARGYSFKSEETQSNLIKGELMKSKAQMFRLNPKQLCLVFLLLLSGAGQIWGQKPPDPDNQTTSPRRQKADVSVTPGNS